MHGILEVSSVLGQGSAFSVDLPIAETATASRPAPEAGDLITRLDYRSDKRVLYVEDMVENVRPVEQILTHRPSITLIPAMLAGIAMDRAREHHPDLILLDLHLPDMPGEEVLQLLHADPATRDIPIVMLSADATQRHIDQLLNASAAAYLSPAPRRSPPPAHRRRDAR
jgi:CheY-like chemotaxis protein